MKSYGAVLLEICWGLNGLSAKLRMHGIGSAMPTDDDQLTGLTGQPSLARAGAAQRCCATGCI